MSDTPRKRTGRRPGKPDTRAHILKTAHRLFQADGFDATSIRAVAREAEVDPALVHRYFGDKKGLILATLEVSFDPAELIDRVVAGGPGHLGLRIATSAISTWESPAGRAMLAAAGGRPNTVVLLVRFLNPMLIEAARRVLGLTRAEAELRASTAETVMAGLVVTRYIARLDPLARLSPEEAARLIAPLLQHAVTGDLGVGAARHPIQKSSLDAALAQHRTPGRQDPPPTAAGREVITD